MSSVDLRVELPSYSYSFHIQVQPEWIVQDVKEEIKRVCPGSPRVDGQRVIWRGRFLRDDERVSDVWKSADDARIVHLSVHPSAWNGTPPESLLTRISRSSTSSSQGLSQRTVRREARAQAVPQTSYTGPLPFIVQKHTDAIHALIQGCLPSTPTQQADVSQLRLAAMYSVQAYGWSWPSALDEEYPPASDPAAGVKYEQVTLEHQQYLRLTNADATPTPFQQHALKVLSHTFPLLSIPAPAANVYSPLPPYNMPYQYTPTVNLNQHLQQLGLPPLRLAAHQNPNQNLNDPNNPIVAEMRAIPLRALLMPLFMLTIRTFILMYFFSPSKRPVFGILLSLWILYETWGALRAVLGNERPGGAAGARGDRFDVGAGGLGANDARPAGQAQAPAADGRNPPTGRRHSDILLNYFANMNLEDEEALLTNDAPATEPGILHKATAFVSLFLTSLHPAVWDRRRGVLRRREGRLRTEANVREAEPAPAPAAAPGAEGESGSSASPAPNPQEEARAQARAQMIARHERRPGWLRNYVERVQNTEWVDDA